MRGRRGHALAALACAAALGLGACGADETEGEKLAPQTASELETLLQEIDNRVSARIPGACTDIEEQNYPQIQERIDAIPDSVDEDLRTALRDSFQRLIDLVDEECAAIRQEAEEEAQETVEEPPPPIEVPEETVPEETETVEEPPAEEIPDEELPPVDPGNGNGNGNNGGGNGNDGNQGNGNGQGGALAPGDG